MPVSGNWICCLIGFVSSLNWSFRRWGCVSVRLWCLTWTCSFLLSVVIGFDAERLLTCPAGLGWNISYILNSYFCITYQSSWWPWPWSSRSFTSRWMWFIGRWRWRDRLLSLGCSSINTPDIFLALKTVNSRDLMEMLLNFNSVRTPKLNLR